MGFRITLQPGDHTFTADSGETILEAANRNGHKLPKGCGDGACGICKGDVLQGTVDHGKATELALSEQEREAGVALFCCARPTSDVVIQPRDWSMMDWSIPMD